MYIIYSVYTYIYISFVILSQSYSNKENSSGMLVDFPYLSIIEKVSRRGCS